MNANKVFLGGTCGSSTWRKVVEDGISVPSFNPVVKDWTEECQIIEENEKEFACNIHLYVITSETKGLFSIAEAVDSVHNRSKDTILCIIPDGFSSTDIKHLKAVASLIRKRGGIAMLDDNLITLINYINYTFENLKL